MRITGGKIREKRMGENDRASGHGVNTPSLNRSEFLSGNP